MKKNWYQYIGNFLTIIALIFLIKKVIAYDLDYNILLQEDNMLCLSICSALFGLHIFLVGISWKTLITILTDKKVPFYIVSDIWCKSNLLKYIPGNVFQYVGRNAIVPKMNLNHIDVGAATIIDILFNIIGVCIVGIISYFPGLRITYQMYFQNNMHFIIIGTVIGILVVCILFYVFQNKLKGIKKRLQKLFIPFNIKKELLCILYYAFWAIYVGTIYIVVLFKMTDIKLNVQEMIVVLGAFLLSWIIGFVLPGAPGGIGIREAALTIILQGQFPIEEILFAIMIYRIVNVIGDLLGLLYSKIYTTFIQRRRGYEC